MTLVSEGVSYSYDEAVEEATKYFKDKMAAQTWARKYALKNEDGNWLENTPDQMFNRMATALSSVEDEQELWFDRFKGQFDGFKKLVMQGSPMAGLGNPKSVSLSNCFVVPSPQDTIKSIFDAVYKMAQIQAFRGGVGLDISDLRPEGAKVSNAANTSTGAWSWCDLFSYVTRMIGQNGRVGALMLTIRCDHPDIIKFIKMKSDLAKVTGANVSVRITDEFMNAVKSDDEIDLWFDFKNEKYEDIRTPIKARDVWSQIVHHATKTAEPGILMWDNIIKHSPLDLYPEHGFATISTNPCSEIPLCADDSCRLASINLMGFVKNPYKKNSTFQWEEFQETISVGVRALDNMIDLDKLPFIEQENKAKNGRRIGLGTHGLADCLAMLGLRYDSSEALERVDKIYNFLMNKTYSASVDLAKERGAFPIWDAEKEIDHPFLNRLDPEVRCEMNKHGRRNGACLTCAPTGSVSIVSKSSSGIEPIFRTHFDRKIKFTNAEDASGADYVDETGDAWRIHKVFHPAVLDYIGKSAKDITDEDLAKAEELFTTSDKIDWEKRIEIQSVMQKYIDHGISSTINLPKGTTEETVGKLYELGWEKGLKGVTVYVDGSRDGVLTTGDTPNTPRKAAPGRPDKLEAVVHTIGSNGHSYNVFLGFLGENIYEVFAVKQSDIGIGVFDGVKGEIVKVASKKYDFESKYITIKRINRHEDDELSSFTRLLSTALRHGVPLETVSEQLHKSKGFISSMAKAINRVISQYSIEEVSVSEPCPNCKAESTYMVKGCQKCKNCSWQSCG